MNKWKAYYVLENNDFKNIIKWTKGKILMHFILYLYARSRNNVLFSLIYSKFRMLKS